MPKRKDESRNTRTLRIPWFLCFLAAGVWFTSCVKPAEEARGLTLAEGVLSAGVEIGYPPMEYYDKDGATLIGFDIELAGALARRLGLQVKFIDTAWEGILAGLDAGRYDVAMNITVLPARQQRHNFTQPYIFTSMTIAALKGAPLKVGKPEDMAGYRVGYQSDTTAQYFIEGLRGQGFKVSAFSYDKITNCFDDLAMGRLDFAAADSIAAFGYAGRENSPFEVLWQGPAGEYIGICLKKGNDPLTIALDKALDELFADGTMARISQQVFHRDLVSALRH